MKMLNDNQILIRERVYTVVLGNLSEEHLGSTDPLHSVITMNMHIEDCDLFRMVLTHELVHAYMFEYGVDQVSWESESIADFISVISHDLEFNVGTLMAHFYQFGKKINVKEAISK